MAQAIRKKPTLRGMSHEWMAYVGLPAGAWLIQAAHTPRALWGSFVYAVSATLMFATSAIYHRPHWNPETRQRLRRADHATIGLMIAGTATPLALLSLDADRARFTLTLVWLAAALMILKALFWKKVHKPLNAFIYVAISAGLAPFFMGLRGALTPQDSGLIALGGAFYVCGALIYAFKRPDPWPAVFGYHEIFHAFIIIAAAIQYSVIYRLVAHLPAA